MCAPLTETVLTSVTSVSYPKVLFFKSSYPKALFLNLATKGFFALQVYTRIPYFSLCLLVS